MTASHAAFTAAVLGTLFSFSVRDVHAGKPVFLGQRQATGQSCDQVDHGVWDQLLRKHVDANGMVNYSAWHASRADRASLQQYIRSLSHVSPAARASKAGRLAFWINAYNAVTIEGILREYPTTSIRNHTAKVLGYNIWKDLQLYVGGRAYSLDAMEHEVLRKMGEPRIHFAIVCASIGCPRLLNQAYQPSQLEQQLQSSARDFFQRPQNFRYDGARQTVHLSSILQWFAKDFGSTQTAMLQTISAWVPEDARAALASGRVRVAFNDYNWQLNDQQRR